MSGADPCTGSKIAVVAEPGAMLALAAIPIPPWSGGDVGQHVAEEVRRDDDVEAERAR